MAGKEQIETYSCLNPLHEGKGLVVIAKAFTAKSERRLGQRTGVWSHSNATKPDGFLTHHGKRLPLSVVILLRLHRTATGLYITNRVYGMKSDRVVMCAIFFW